VGNEGQIVRYRQLGKDGGFEVVPVAKELLCLNMLGSGTTLALCTCAVLLHTDGGTNQNDTSSPYANRWGSINAWNPPRGQGLMEAQAN
jgi:hypothetical protein